MGQRMWDSVEMFAFHEIYSISFGNKLNFANYIIKNNSHIICALEIFKVQAPHGRSQYKKLVNNKLNRILFIETYMY
jgi:hypothetical protein